MEIFYESTKKYWNKDDFKNPNIPNKQKQWIFRYDSTLDILNFKIKREISLYK